MHMLHPLALGMPGPIDWLVIGLIGLLLFGKRLPEVGRSIGKTIVEFKKGMREVEEEMRTADANGGTSAYTGPYNTPYAPPAQATAPRPALEQQAAPPIAAPAAQVAQPAQPFKFDPYTGKPLTPDAAPAQQNNA